MRHIHLWNNWMPKRSFSPAPSIGNILIRFIQKSPTEPLMNWLLRGSAVPVVGVLLLASLPSAALATDTPEQIALMASACANCHGTDGRLAGNIPALAGVSADQLEA